MVFFTFAFAKGECLQLNCTYFIFIRILLLVHEFPLYFTGNNKILKRPQIAAIIIRSHNFRYT